jgi:hypothetical protein
MLLCSASLSSAMRHAVTVDGRYGGCGCGLWHSSPPVLACRCWTGVRARGRTCPGKKPTLAPRALACPSSADSGHRRVASPIGLASCSCVPPAATTAACVLPFVCSSFTSSRTTAAIAELSTEDASWTSTCSPVRFSSSFLLWPRATGSLPSRGEGGSGATATGRLLDR